MKEIISILPDAIANQIAAGEVIQRPSSVVKELMENAVDAGASQIKVIVKDSGKQSIQVIDDGSGMSAIDLRTSIERHATSKIKSAEDLFAIHSMGFRGEALPSIVSVSQVEIRSKREEDQMGNLLQVEGSKIIKQEPIAFTQGTSFIVKNLFYNIPARRKFLKSNKIELKHIIEQFLRIALPFTDISFELIYDANPMYHLDKGSFRQRIVQLFGSKYNEKLVPLNESTDFVNIRGFVGKPEAAKKSRGDQYFFVNKRFIKSSYLHNAVAKAFENLLPAGYHPSYFILLEIEPSWIDINIHPTKTEVKFEDEYALYAILHSAVKRGLGANNIAPSLDFNQEGNFNTLPKKNWDEIQLPKITVDPNFNPFKMQQATPSSSTKSKGDWSELFQNEKDWLNTDEGSNAIPSSGDEAEHLFELESAYKAFQTKGKYIVTHIKSGIVVINIQRAQERILYERNLHALATQRGVSQKKLFPEEFSLSPIDWQIAKSLGGPLELLGFDLEFFDNEKIKIKAAPLAIANLDPKPLIEDVINEFRSIESEEEINKLDRLALLISEAEAKTVQRSLQKEEIDALIDSLFACEQAYYTPSGAATLISLNYEELERKFE